MKINDLPALKESIDSKILRIEFFTIVKQQDLIIIENDHHMRKLVVKILRKRINC